MRSTADIGRVDQIEGGIRDAAAIDEISDPAAQEQHPVKARSC